MSYDLEIGTHERPTRAQIESWAAEQGLTVEPNGEDSLVVSRPARRGDGYLFEVGGPACRSPPRDARSVRARRRAGRTCPHAGRPTTRRSSAGGRTRTLARPPRRARS